MPASRIVVSGRVTDENNSPRVHANDDDENINDDNGRVLELMMIACEEDAPYGPSDVTAKLMIQLICEACRRYYASSVERDLSNKVNMIRITVYHAQSQDYPSTKEEWDRFDGILIPGSHSNAYDVHVDWIGRLHSVIRDEIHKYRRKTLAICFGHQSFAHAFSSSDGLAVKCPSGSKAGRHTFQLTSVGKHLLCSHTKECSSTLKESIDLLYTHGDMVQKIPSFGLSLGGNDKVPIQSAAYFESEEMALQFYIHANEMQQFKCDSSTITQQTLEMYANKHGQSSLPYAITFQAHPEYVTSDGFNVNFMNTIKAMHRWAHIDESTLNDVVKDVEHNFDRAYNDSLDGMVAVGIVLQWF